MRRKGKAIALSTATLGLVVLVAVGFVLMNPILERWYLDRLERGDEAERLHAIKRLGDVGGEEAVLRLRELNIRESPVLLFRIGLPGQGGVESDPGLPPPPLGPQILNDAIHEAIPCIRARIGWERDRAAMVRCIKNPTADARTRAWFSQLWIFSVTPDEVLPGLLMERGVDHPAPGTPLYQEYFDDKPAAIAACIDALSSNDRYARGGAAFALSMCGPEARGALPAIQKVLKDPDFFVREAAADALERIQGNNDEAQR